MRRTTCALLTAALAAVLLLVAPLGPATAARPRLSARLAAGTVYLGKPITVSGVAPGRIARPARLELRTSTGTWRVLKRVRTARTGRFQISATASRLGTDRLRILAPAVRRHRSAVSPTLTLTVRAVPVRTLAPPTPPVDGCTPGTSATDPAADASAADLMTTLAEWRTDKLMAVGQQVNISDDGQWQDVLAGLAPQHVAVIGFDLAELAQAEARGVDPLPDLIDDAKQDGAVLVATWHATNPWDGTGDAYDRTDASHLSDLLSTTTTAGAAFWQMWDDQVAGPLARIRDAGLPVIFRPFHEANGNWFWWSNPNPTVYKALWAMAQQRAAAEDLQNVVWSYTAALRNSSAVTDPVALLPACVELGGLDSYEPAGQKGSSVSLTDYARLEAKVPFMTLSEVGAKGSDGSWDPNAITSTLKAQKQYASYALLWFDDSDGKKQIASLDDGEDWLAGCSATSGTDGFCRLS
ncbi:MAG TPA: glycosyl hydrolase [Marmoricola sp.]|nr:glycosyl hydrolase [Marmoricola sp.]